MLKTSYYKLIHIKTLITTDNNSDLLTRNACYGPGYLVLVVWQGAFKLLRIKFMCQSIAYVFLDPGFLKGQRRRDSSTRLWRIAVALLVLCKSRNYDFSWKSFVAMFWTRESKTSIVFVASEFTEKINKIKTNFNAINIST